MRFTLPASSPFSNSLVVKQFFPFLFFFLLVGKAIASPVLVASDRRMKTEGPLIGRPGCEPDTANVLHFISARRKTEEVWDLAVRGSLKEGLKALDPGKPLVLYVHGDGKDFRKVLDRAWKIHDKYDVQVLAFDYPSFVPDLGGLRNYYNSRRNAEAAVDKFIALLRQLQEEPVIEGMAKTLFLHSLGNHVLEVAIRQKGCEELVRSLFSNILLNSACVNLRDHHQWVEQLGESPGIYITYNKKDHVLKGAMLITLRRKLGAKLRGSMADNAEYVNFRKVAFMEHNYFVKPPVVEKYPFVKEFYRTIFHGKKVDLEDKTVFTERRNGRGYTIGG